MRGSEIETGFIGGGGLFSWLSIQLSLFPSCRGADQRLDRDCTIHHPRDFFSNYCACRISQLSKKNSREAYIVQVQYANLARSAKAVARFMHPLLPSNMDYSWQWKLDDCYFKRVTQGRLRLAKQRWKHLSLAVFQFVHRRDEGQRTGIGAIPSIMEIYGELHSEKSGDKDVTTAKLCITIYYQSANFQKDYLVRR